MLKCRRRIQKTAPMPLDQDRKPWIQGAGALLAAALRTLRRVLLPGTEVAVEGTVAARKEVGLALPAALAAQEHGNTRQGLRERVGGSAAGSIHRRGGAIHPAP